MSGGAEKPVTGAKPEAGAAESKNTSAPAPKEYKKFLAPGLKPFDAKTTEKRRRSEVLTYLAMAGIYCRSKHADRQKESWKDENGKELRFFGRRVFLCESCRKKAKAACLRTSHCKHMAYKTFCHNCPRPCHGHDPEAAEMMRFSGPRLLLYHPILGIHYFQFLIRAMKRNKPPKT